MNTPSPLEREQMGVKNFVSAGWLWIIHTGREMAIDWGGVKRRKHLHDWQGGEGEFHRGGGRGGKKAGVANPILEC